MSERTDRRTVAPDPPSKGARSVAVQGQAVTVCLSGRAIVDRIDFAAHYGELTCVLGPNGAGKSTLLRAMAGLLPFDGQIAFQREGVKPISPYVLPPAERPRWFAYVPQRSGLHAPITTQAVVEQGRYAHVPFAFWPGAKRGTSDSSEDSEDVRKAMERTDVLALAHTAFDELSEGERRRVLLARALATGARILLLDEPSAALDIGHALALFEILRELRSDGYSVVVVLHALEDALRFFDTALLMDDGRVVAHGAPASVLTARTLDRVYGVRRVDGSGPSFQLLNPHARPAPTRRAAR